VVDYPASVRGALSKYGAVIPIIRAKAANRRNFKSRFPPPPAITTNLLVPLGNFLMDVGKTPNIGIQDSSVLNHFGTRKLGM
jgi:hypothetical protein